MQLLLKSTVWLGLIIVLYAYVLYPVGVSAVARLRRESLRVSAMTEAAPAVSVGRRSMSRVPGSGAVSMRSSH